MKAPSLLIPKLTFYSSRDEDAFFKWLRSIPSVLQVVGHGRNPTITLKSNRLSEAALRELLALHHRYKLPMRSLARFESRSNSRWFRAKGTFWHSKVFGRADTRMVR